MGRTITLGKIMGAVQRDVPRLNDVDFAADVAASLINKIWTKDFRETFAELPPFYLIGNKQDYGPPIYAVPFDFSRLQTATLFRLVDQNTSITRHAKPLLVKTDQQLVMRHGTPELCSYEPSTNCFRIFPVLPENTPTNEYLIGGVYKTLPKSNLVDNDSTIGRPILSSQIVGANYNNVLVPIDDKYYETMVKIAKFLAKPAPSLQEEVARDNFISNELSKIASVEGVDVGTSNVTPFDPLYTTSGRGWGGLIY